MKYSSCPVLFCILYYLDNRFAVGVMANNTLRLHLNARKLIIGEKTHASGSPN